MARNAPDKVTLEIENQLKNFLVELYCHQHGIEDYTYEEFDRPQELKGKPVKGN